MARRTARIRERKSKPKMDTEILSYGLDYHEGFSRNQVKVILREFGFDRFQLQRFNEWMSGQTCPMVIRHNRKSGKEERVCGIYEYDLFRWIESQKKGTPLIWD